MQRFVFIQLYVKKVDFINVHCQTTRTPLHVQTWTSVSRRTAVVTANANVSTRTAAINAKTVQLAGLMTAIWAAKVCWCLLADSCCKQLLQCCLKRCQPWRLNTRIRLVVDLNECTAKHTEVKGGGCDIERECTNTQGGFKCGDCPPGWANHGMVACIGTCLVAHALQFIDDLSFNPPSGKYFLLSACNRVCN